MERPSDEEILKFEQSIKEKEVLEAPLVGPVEPMEHLTREYEHGAHSFQQKIEVRSAGGRDV
jgi:hypothetical protein